MFFFSSQFLLFYSSHSGISNNRILDIDLEKEKGGAPVTMRRECRKIKQRYTQHDKLRAYNSYQINKHQLYDMSSDNNTCANCGKGEEESRNLKACTACKLVKYCNRDCQIAHRSQHKRACKKRVAELHDEALFKQPPLPEDCPICLIPCPRDQSVLNTCCGKRICIGCFSPVIAEAAKRGRRDIDTRVCPFCTLPMYQSYDERYKRLNKLIEKGNAEACCHLAEIYSGGRIMGLPQNHAKANDLFLQAGKLGCARAYHHLGISYDNGTGVERDMKKVKHFFELAAMGGDVYGRHGLGCMEGRAGNHCRAMKHFMIAARTGHNDSLDRVKEGFMIGIVKKDEYGDTLRAYQKWHDETESDARDNAMAESTTSDLFNLI